MHSWHIEIFRILSDVELKHKNNDIGLIEIAII